MDMDRTHRRGRNNRMGRLASLLRRLTPSVAQPAPIRVHPFYPCPSVSKPHPALIAAPIVVGLTSLSGCGTTLVRQGVERRVRNRLASLLGPARKYSVRIRGSQDRQLVKGRA